ncbi:toprim domain-containing protein [Tsuneonella sp. YG55]|uniref:Toprim domain-containing protein n=1 Tax=Tsuneonella litorea TaxID=2976475 RepID=A0A9X2W319_9SPHN|nr:toprim domain-containing protein [Tsuneonella litorea]MCT2560048.1 toprim domain-containing protein [Tsuneonella litorea]
MSLSVQTHPNRSLAETARRICESRGGKWSGTKGMACCPAHDDRTPSLGVSLGRHAILFHCFAGCDQQRVLAALAREGFEAPALFSGSATTNEPESTSTRKPSAVALRIWRDAQPLRASPAKAYLESRGILAASPALRFHPRTPLGPKGRARFLPAMIAAVSLDDGPIAIHRTFLSTKASGKAAFDKPKRALGAPGQAAVRLFAPASGKLGLAEGIESAMSAYALTGIPVWATLGNERFGLVRVPESVTELHLFVDHDAGGELAASRGIEAHARDGRTIQVRNPSSRDTDWNDELTAWLRRKAAR